MRIAIVGTGHVGLVTAAAFAVQGHEVLGVDEDQRKLHALAAGQCPFYEPGLPELVDEAVAAGRLTFSASIPDALAFAEVVFLCVGTPARPDGEANMVMVERVARQIAQALPAGRHTLVVEKSTVPVRTGERIAEVLSRNAPSGAGWEVASNPEFLREGAGVYDAMQPSRLVVGVGSRRAEHLLRRVYEPVVSATGCAFIVTDMRTAEIIKHACNAFLAAKISFVNMVAALCERLDADVSTVSLAMGLDPRIGHQHLEAGMGYGGYCLPKDVAAFIRILEAAGVDAGLLESVAAINAGRPASVAARLTDLLWNLEGKTVVLLGLAFKPDTDDLRDSPALALGALLASKGCAVRGWDPQAGRAARESTDIEVADDVYDALNGADAAVVCTGWSELRDLDWARVRHLMAQPVVVDGRNFLDAQALAKLGFTVAGVGRPAVQPVP